MSKQSKVEITIFVLCTLLVLTVAVLVELLQPGTLLGVGAG